MKSFSKVYMGKFQNEVIDRHYCLNSKRAVLPFEI